MRIVVKCICRNGVSHSNLLEVKLGIPLAGRLSVVHVCNTKIRFFTRSCAGVPLQRTSTSLSCTVPSVVLVLGALSQSCFRTIRKCFLHSRGENLSPFLLHFGWSARSLLLHLHTQSLARQSVLVNHLTGARKWKYVPIKQQNNAASQNCSVENSTRGVFLHSAHLSQQYLPCYRFCRCLKAHDGSWSMATQPQPRMYCGGWRNGMETPRPWSLICFRE